MAKEHLALRIIKHRLNLSREDVDNVLAAVEVVKYSRGTPLWDWDQITKAVLAHGSPEARQSLYTWLREAKQSIAAAEESDVVIFGIPEHCETPIRSKRK